MQTICKEDKNIHWLLDDIEHLYSQLSSKNYNKPLIPKKYHSSFKKLCNIFKDNSDYDVPETFYDKKIEPLNLPNYDTNNIIICFSGGKDSIALTLKCLKKGYNVYLYTLKHINASLSDESKWANEVAEKLNVPIFIDDIKLKGHNDWMEHPMKNMIIANGALNYGIKNNIGTRIWFGNYTTSYLEDIDFARCAGDCMDMWESYNEIITNIIPGFHIECDLETMGETLEIITPQKDILDLSLSCLCRHSLRQYRWNWVKETFDIELPKNRCGSCYKCCVEYIYMADHNLIKFSKDYYKYCINQLYRVYLNEKGLAFSVRTVWETFMFYDMEDSKIYEDLSKARLFIRSVKWENEPIRRTYK